MGIWVAGSNRVESCHSHQECRTGLFGVFLLLGDSLSRQGLERAGERKRREWGGAKVPAEELPYYFCESVGILIAVLANRGMDLRLPAQILASGNTLVI